MQCTLDLQVRIDRHLARRIVGQADRQLHLQLTATRFGALTADQPRTQHVQLGLAHRPLQAEQQTVVEVAGVVQPVLVKDERIGQGARVIQARRQPSGTSPPQWNKGSPGFPGEDGPGAAVAHGTVDTKSLTAWALTCCLLLRRHGLRMKRDLIFAATADEEVDGELGLGWLVANRPDLLLDAEFGINEGGGYELQVAGRRFFTYQTSEKSVCRLQLHAIGEAGHGAVPHDDNAVVHLTSAVSRMTARLLPPRRTPTVEALVATLSRAMSDAGLPALDGIWEADGWSSSRLAHLDRSLLGQLDCMVRDTVAPTRLQAGSATNVIPSEAFAWIDGRLLPGRTPEAFVADLRTIVGERVAVEVVESNTSIESPTSGPLVEMMRAAVQRHVPGAELVPLMSLGATDSRYLRERGIPMYGFKPMQYEAGAEPTRLMHNHDERISVANVEFGLQVLWDVVTQAVSCGAA